MVSKFGGVPIEQEQTTSRFGGVAVEQQPAQPVQQPFTPSLYERAKSIYGQRAGNIESIVGGSYPEQTGTENVLQTLGQVAGGVGEVVGDVVMTGVKAVTPDEIENYFSEKAQSALQTGTGQAALGGVKSGLEFYNEWSSENPRLARNVEAVFNVGAFGLPAAKAGIEGAKMAGKGIVKKAGEVSKALTPAPTFDDVKTAEKLAWGMAYDAAEKSGAKLPTVDLGKSIDFNFKSLLGRDSVVDPDLHPKTVMALQKVKESLGEGEVTPQQIQIARRKLNELREQSKGEMGKVTDDTRLMGDLIESFDDAVDKVASRTQNREVTDMFKEARRVSKVKYKVDLLNDAFERADKSGSSFDRAIKNEFRRIANNKRKMRGFSDKERALINSAASTGITENILRSLSIFDPTSGKLSAGIGLGAANATGNMLIPVMGIIAKSGAEGVAKSKAKKAMRNVLMELDPNAPTIGQKVIETIKNQKKVKSKDLATEANSIHEWGYDPVKKRGK